VGIVSYEDDRDEWHRRIAAACEHYGVDYDLALDNIRFIIRPRERICFATEVDGRTLYPDGDEIIRILKEIGAALLIIDPFNQAHGFDDGNADVIIARVAAEMNRIAEESNAAAMVLHHLRKGSTGQPDDMMGATSLRATFQLPDTGTHDAGGSKGTRYRQGHLAIQQNLRQQGQLRSPPDKANWFRLESVAIDNATEKYPDGDSVQVTATWQPAALMDGINASELSAIFEAIQAGTEPGGFFSPRKQSNNWIGHLIVRLTGKNDDQVGLIVKEWLKNELIQAKEYTNPKGRNKVEGIVLNVAKASVLAGGAWFAPQPD
jgi:hypothetical protein